MPELDPKLHAFIEARKIEQTAKAALRAAMRCQQQILDIIELGSKGRLSEENAAITREQFERDLAAMRAFLDLLPHT